jgi:type VI secretion system protein ImpL
MAKTLRIFSWILVLVLVTATAVAVGYWSFVLRRWPLWIALGMALGVFGLFFLVLFFKKYLVRRNEKKFVRRIVEHGEVLGENARPEQLAVQELEKSWKENLKLLKSSHLRKQGNPVYALPWFLTMGESGVGKSTMLVNAGIATSFTEVEDRHGRVVPTRNCDWLFFDRSIILDTAGRYSVPLESDQHRLEWRRFLYLLAGTRRKEPLNGILLFVAADDLCTLGSQELGKKGQILRNRIHSLMRTLGYRIPVFVMVTKMDRIPGFIQFARRLSPGDGSQAMGRLNIQATPFWRELLDQMMDDLDAGLQKIRLTMISRPGGKNAALFSFPRQVKKIGKGLEPFLDALFSENNYQETPAIQGIYFGCGRCGGPESKNGSPDKPLAQVADSGTSAALFARDFLTSVVPKARWNFSPVKEFVVWKKVVHNLALISWLCILGFAVGIIGLSYFHNRKVYEILPQEASALSVSRATDINSVLTSLEEMRLAIESVEKLNDSWRLPFMIFSNGLQAEKACRKQYCRLFETQLLDPVELRFQQRVNGLDTHTPLELYADYCAYSVEQSIFLQDYLTGRKFHDFSSFDRVSLSVLSIDHPGLLPEVAAYFSGLNKSYLAWSEDRDGMKERLAVLQKTLQKLLAVNRGDTAWLFTESIADTPAVILSDFWQLRKKDIPDTVLVPGAFTAKGRKNIDNFLDAADQAGAGKEIVHELRRGYHDSYSRQFVHWWKRFGDNFQDGELLLTTESDWRDMAIRMAESDNPFFRMLDTMAAELTAYGRDTGKSVPPWGTSVIKLNKVRLLAASVDSGKKVQPSFLSKLDKEKDKVVATTLKDVDPNKARELNEQLKLASLWKTYEQGLLGLNRITPYREKAAAQFTAWFREAGKNGKESSAFASVFDAWVALESTGQRSNPDPFVWKIVKGPFVFLQDFAARETAYVLQAKWQEKVLSVVAEADPGKSVAMLFAGSKGLVWEYVHKYASAFVEKSLEGYRARKLFGRSLVFNPDFFSLLNLGSALIVNAQPEYTVTLATQPIEVNSEATLDPTYAVLTMQCAEKKYELRNDNFPRELSVKWSQDKCGDVTLRIGFPTLELSRKWTGSLAFVHFLEQFAKGRYTFRPEEFTGNAGFLKEHRISGITLTYVLSGAQDVLQLLNEPPRRLPQSIIEPDRQVTAKHFPELSARTIEEFVDTPQTVEEVKNSAKQADSNSPRAVRHKEEREKSHKKTVRQHPSVSWHDAAWLRKQNPALYTVQIMSLTSAEPVRDAFAQAPERKNNAVFRKTVRGRDWFVLVSGLFTTREQAENYIESLPETLQKASPLIRSLQTIQTLLTGDHGKESKQSGQNRSGSGFEDVDDSGGDRESSQPETGAQDR